MVKTSVLSEDFIAKTFPEETPFHDKTMVSERELNVPRNIRIVSTVGMGLRSSTDLL